MEKQLHISQTGENWEVEDDSQTLAQAESKAEAIEVAMDVARESGAQTVVVHTADGKIETAISVPREAQ